VQYTAPRFQKAFTEMDQHGGLSLSQWDDGSEKQQPSYHSQNEDLDAQGGYNLDNNEEHCSPNVCVWGQEQKRREEAKESFSQGNHVGQKNQVNDSYPHDEPQNGGHIEEEPRMVWRSQMEVLKNVQSKKRPICRTNGQPVGFLRYYEAAKTGLSLT
jgi:hypothetical protein